MIRLISTMLLLFSAFTYASSGTGGVPNLPCSVDGQYLGSMEITRCNELKSNELKKELKKQVQS
ncbi:hypothetical protein [Vibrio hippocampi]|uniref:Uncharacterized protein n=1 Tax=Vibrio hippocampi TaxID=654686 RepID=A0ABM8ZIK0_9VIBR|nr:hypothetical protein [Vibrio hippocampi]CAH0526656.1 hypothetical protein VHP8226_02026 [Vibrio hippocampi]